MHIDNKGQTSDLTMTQLELDPPPIGDKKNNNKSSEYDNYTASEFESMPNPNSKSFGILGVELFQISSKGSIELSPTGREWVCCDFIGCTLPNETKSGSDLWGLVESDGTLREITQVLGEFLYDLHEDGHPDYPEMCREMNQTARENMTFLLESLERYRMDIAQKKLSIEGILW